MSKNTIIIDGTRFDDMTTFYDEIERKFTKGLNWNIGRNINAYNDVLRGGFGVHGYQEPVKVIWHNYLVSQQRLPKDELETLVALLKSHDHIEFIIEE